MRWQPGDFQTVCFRDEQGLHPVRLEDNVIRAELTRSPAVTQTQLEPQCANNRWWEKEADAGVGAAAGGVGGLIYDLVTRDTK